jgi:hypothetical protein
MNLLGIRVGVTGFWVVGGACGAKGSGIASMGDVIASKWGVNVSNWGVDASIVTQWRVGWVMGRVFG